ncbi:hypothetical protein LQ564_04070 [Massilia sp. G4R7]|uniref:Uncharacterized protein n=1 Tax=Massilia phyllostachyos TaxID=2898585 RepID=A0ABS8Q1L9_9BURK|nr:hypothetical protein [Massilia phyllostachyos]MCD2515484.1 hypothetical protein [Massilia phyllostachyos]
MYEYGNEYIGTVFVLPETRCFELKTTVHGAPAVVHGTISQQLATRFAEGAADRSIRASSPCSRAGSKS